MTEQRIEYKNSKKEGKENLNDAEIAGMVHEIQKKWEESTWQDSGLYID